MPAAAQHPARAGVSGGAHRAAGVDGVADPQAQRAEPPVMDRPAHRARHPPLRALSWLASWCTSTSRRSADPPGGGWRVHGRGSDRAKRANRSKRRPVGYTFLHVAIDDYSRVAYVEAHDNETARHPRRILRRAQDWYWSNDMAVDEVLTDNGPNFVSDAFADLLAVRRILHRGPGPIGHQTTAKAERFNRTLADEFLYKLQVQIRERAPHPPQTLDPRLQLSPTPHRRRGPPASRANNLTRTDS